MGRYIDADDFKSEVRKLSKSPFNEWDTWGVLSVLEKVPTADVAPVIHAHWRPSKEPKHEKEFSRFFVCTNCSRDIQLRHAGIVEDIGFEYCPHCGAKMDEKVE